MLKCEVASTPEDICEKRLLFCKQLRRCSVKSDQERIVFSSHVTPHPTKGHFQSVLMKTSHDVVVVIGEKFFPSYEMV